MGTIVDAEEPGPGCGILRPTWFIPIVGVLRAMYLCLAVLVLQPVDGPFNLAKKRCSLWFRERWQDLTGRCRAGAAARRQENEEERCIWGGPDAKVGELCGRIRAETAAQAAAQMANEITREWDRAFNRARCEVDLASSYEHAADRVRNCIARHQATSGEEGMPLKHLVDTDWREDAKISPYWPLVLSRVPSGVVAAEDIAGTNIVAELAMRSRPKGARIGKNLSMSQALDQLESAKIDALRKNEEFNSTRVNDHARSIADEIFQPSAVRLVGMILLLLYPPVAEVRAFTKDAHTFTAWQVWARYVYRKDLASAIVLPCLGLNGLYIKKKRYGFVLKQDWGGVLGQFIALLMGLPSAGWIAIAFVVHFPFLFGLFFWGYCAIGSALNAMDSSRRDWNCGSIIVFAVVVGGFFYALLFVSVTTSDSMIALIIDPEVTFWKLNELDVNRSVICWYNSNLNLLIEKLPPL